MMETIKLLIFCLLLGVCINACSRDEIMIFKEEQNSLNFPKYQYLSTTYKYDSLQFSSVFSGGKEVADFYIPIRVAGSVSDQDREYRLRVNPEETFGIKENTHYTLETTQLFRAGRYIDSTVVKINVQAIKDDAVEGRIYIELVPNENFVRGLDFYQYMIVNVSGVGLSSQPTLWRTNSLDTYGGTYSSVKAEKFIELNGILEEDWKAPNKAILYAYAKKTYEWFENNPTYDNGELVVFKGTIEY